VEVVEQVIVLMVSMVDQAEVVQVDLQPQVVLFPLQDKVMQVVMVAELLLVVLIHTEVAEVAEQGQQEVTQQVQTILQMGQVEQV
tara:strand:+ start:227 stop:481 length:255 start_codon:yes stop_codon:yes gene_type:complete